MFSSFILSFFLLADGTAFLPVEVKPETTWEDTYTITAYTAGPESTGKSPGDEGYGITSSGEPVKEGVTIACPKDIPFYTVIEIEDVGERVCEDRGSAITGKKLDLYVETVPDAMDWGVRQRKIRIKEDTNEITYRKIGKSFRVD